MVLCQATFLFILSWQSTLPSETEALLSTTPYLKPVRSKTFALGRVEIPLLWSESQLFSSITNDDSAKSLPNEDEAGLTLLNHHKEQRTLYEILNSPPNATREELKKQYILLARSLHPDAKIGLLKSSDADSSPDIDFTEVAAAWRILSDRRQRQRYDRSLRAKEFADEVELAVSRFGADLVPTVRTIFDKVAMPFLRRTTDTTATMLSQAVTDLAMINSTAMEFTNAISNAVRDSLNGGNEVKRSALLEKSRELDQRAKFELESVREMQAKVDAIAEQRLRLALRIPNASFSSSEAERYLEKLVKFSNRIQNTDPPSLVETTRLKYTIRQDISMLENYENNFSLEMAQNRKLRLQLSEQKRNYKQAQRKLEEAILAEEEARKALIAAQRLTKLARQDVHIYENYISSSETEYQKSEAETQRIGLALERQQGRVKKSLRDKEERILRMATDLDKASIQSKDGVPLQFEILKPSLAEYTELKNKESALMTECRRLEDRVHRLQSRAMKLKLKAEVMGELNNQSRR